MYVWIDLHNTQIYALSNIHRQVLVLHDMTINIEYRDILLHDMIF